MFFINIGGTARVSVKEILSYSAPGSAQIKRIVAKAKDTDRLVDVTGNDSTRSVVLTKTGYVYTSPIRPETLDKRIQGTAEGTEEGET